MTEEVRASLASQGYKPTARPGSEGTFAFRCIRHEDKNASAWFGEKKWGCAACGFEEDLKTLCESLGIEAPKYGYTLEDYADQKRFDINRLRRWGLQTTTSDRGGQVVEIPYLDTEGKAVLRSRYRGRNGAWWASNGHGLYLYGLEKLAKNPQHPVVVVEGESDCHACWHHGILAVGVPGASAWRKDWAHYLRDRSVYIWQEPDKAGAEFTQRVGFSFPDAKVIRHKKFKDLADLHKAFPTTDEFRKEFDALVRDAHPVGITPPSVEFDSLTGDTLDRLHEAKLKPIDAVPMPLPSWNVLCRDEGGGKGVARGWHVIVGGRPGFGKSIVALNIAKHAIENGERVAFLSLEMSQMQLATRLMSMVSGVPIGELEHGQWFNSTSFNAAKRVLDVIHAKTGGAVFVNRGKISALRDIETAVRYHHAVNGCRIVIVDYLQLAWTGSAAGIFDRVMEISKTLRDLAVELNIVSIGLSQFNRETTANRTAPPTAQGLMGGSVLENDADQIILLDHSRYEEANGGMAWKTNVILDKNRHGKIGVLPVIFHRRTLRMEDDTPITVTDTLRTDNGIKQEAKPKPDRALLNLGLGETQRSGE